MDKAATQPVIYAPHLSARAVELAAAGNDTNIATALDPDEVPDLKLPAKLWGIIQAVTGWFTLQTPSSAAAE